MGNMGLDKMFIGNLKERWMEDLGVDEMTYSN
jgi:hypothetical protein